MKKFILAAILFLAPSLSFGQGARYDQPFLKPLPSGGVTGVVGNLTVCLGTGLTTTALTITSNVATVTMSSNPVTAGFINGRDILLINFSGGDAFLNSTFTLTSVTSTQLQFSITHGNWTASSNGGAVMKPTASAGCAPLAIVYSDAALSSTLSQPFGTDNFGNAQFFGPSGLYWVALSASGVNPIPLSLETLGVVANSSGQIVSTLASPTPPFVVASNGIVTNLDADELDGQHGPTGFIIGTTDNQTLTNKIFDVSANTLKNSSNTSGHFVRNNGAQYVDSTIAATDMPTFVASGASHAPGAVPDPGVSAGTTKFLREDATWVAPASASEVAVSSQAVASLQNALTELNAGTPVFFLPSGHTLIRLGTQITTAGVTCSTAAVIALKDVTAASNVTTFTLAVNPSGVQDSGAISFALTAAHEFAVIVSTGATGCGTFPVGKLWAVYQ